MARRPPSSLIPRTTSSYLRKAAWYRRSIRSCGSAFRRCSSKIRKARSSIPCRLRRTPVRTCRISFAARDRQATVAAGFPAHPRRGERGFAMLLVFLMASMIAISLYMELPRVAMQSQRAKEQLLIDRGEQYKRAIYLFYKAAKRYPGEPKDLENFQNKRFLRHRYIDPMTGKDEWRLIHVQNGVLTDSLVNKQGQNQQKEASAPSNFVGELAGLGSTQNPQGAGGAANVRNRIRQSDGAVINGPPGEVPPGMNNGQPPMPGTNQPYPTASYPGGQLQLGQLQQAGQPQLGQPQYGQPQYGQPQLGQPQYGQPQAGQLQGIPGQVQPGAPGSPYQAGIPNSNLPGGALPNAGRGGVQPTPAPASSGGGFVGSSGGFVGGGSLVGSQPNAPGVAGQYPGGQYPGTAYPAATYPGAPLPGQPGAPVNSYTGE